MLELTQDQLKQIKYNKIKQIKAILIEFASIQRNNKIAARYNASVIDKLKYTCAKEANIPIHLADYNTIEYKYDTPTQKIYKGLFHFGYEKLELKDGIDWVHLAAWLDKVTFWYSLYIDSDKKEVKIFNKGNECAENIINTLYFILYNKLKNKKRGHTHDDQKYIEEHKEHWKLMLEGMGLCQEILELHYVKS